MRPRAEIADLELQGSPNIRRSKNLGEVKSLQKRAELEAIFADVSARRDVSLAALREEGVVITVDKFTARGELYQARILNPHFKVVQACEGRLAQLAKLLSVVSAVKPKETAAELLASMDELLHPEKGVS
jgi:hypothetical protein